MLFKVGKESGVGESLQARRVVRHDIGLPGDVADCREVAVAALVGASEAAQVRRSSLMRDRAFGVPRHCRGVVGENLDGAAP